MPAGMALLLVAIHAAAAQAVEAGAFECPCLVQLPPEPRSALESLGYTKAGYGVGCQRHDETSTLDGCGASDPPEHCASPWCYVDADTCAVDEGKCREAGGSPGSDASPHCRERQVSPSVVLAGTLNGTNMLHYSYATCGALDTYSPRDKLAKHFIGHTIVIAITESRPWTFRSEIDPNRPQWIGWSGVLVDLIDDFAKTSNLNISVVEGFASVRSKEMHSSSYTACVFDVSVGAVDLCLADFWITPERLKYSSFVTAFSQDQMWLLVPDQLESNVGDDLFEKPIQPFSPQLWNLVIGFLIFSALVNAFTDADNTDDFPNAHPVGRICKALQMSFSGTYILAYMHACHACIHP